MASPNRTLLITATITPSAATTRLVRSDPDVRRMDYLKAVSWYAEHLSPRGWSMVLAENSNSDLGDLIAAAEQHGHVLTVVRSKPGPLARQGKGNGEAALLDDAFRVISPSLRPDHQLVKATGRLIAKNLEAAVPRPSAPHLSARMHRDRSMADTRVFAADVATWGRFLVGLGSLVDEEAGRFFEHAVALRTAEALFKSDAVWVPFSTELWVSGTSGTDGLRYDTPRARVTRIAKTLLDRLPQGDYR